MILIPLLTSSDCETLFGPPEVVSLIICYFLVNSDGYNYSQRTMQLFTMPIVKH